MASRASSRQVSGASSAGLTTIVLPTAIAGATSVTMIGPGTFHGMMLPQTPNGYRSAIPRTSWHGARGNGRGQGLAGDLVGQARHIGQRPGHGRWAPVRPPDLHRLQGVVQIG